GLRQRNGNASGDKVLTPSDEGKKIDQVLDSHVEYEFGGPWGVLAIMTGFPILMYYLWICLVFYDGHLVHPTSQDDIVPFLTRMWAHICTDASPNLYAWTIYSALIGYQLLLAWIMPGVWQEGLPVPSLGYKTLMYKCNAVFSLYASMITAAALHYTGTFPLQDLIDN
ncbi:ergosterol biosynthesis ERG4/ERG24, partial [Amylocystis lapponica]